MHTKIAIQFLLILISVADPDFILTNFFPPVIRGYSLFKRSDKCPETGMIGSDNILFNPYYMGYIPIQCEKPHNVNIADPHFENCKSG